MSKDNGHALSIVFADDDSDDRMFFEDAVAVIPGNFDVRTANDGVQLMDLLLGPEPNLPDILFLDLNMPRKNGYECLKEIRSNPALRDMFIVIYSTTASPREIAETFEMGANLFVNKPNTFSELKRVLTKVLGLDLKVFSPPEKSKFVLEVTD